ncbi:hypothetical protein PVAND_015486 [Polypedilum vanderplanki]|uniref:CHK kinase-like domain-containing protein n=1 Tax=Polypedilum vanderplanki TaxID=319348 RepID=A0A9J6BD95_POLVA|nr:hypothetical protein PVAND_015486 [Polypedilum vanderplanki]
MIELTTEECQEIIQILSNSNDIEIVKFSAEHFGDFLGFLGEYYRLNITAIVNNNEPQGFQFFAKSLPIKDLRKRRSMLIKSGIFKKEFQIYKEILSKFIKIDVNDGIWCSKVFLVRDDLIVFNDLTLENFKVLPDGVSDFEVEYVEATLKTLAAFHACSIAFEKQQNVQIGEKFSEILFETSVMDHGWFHSGLATIQKIAELHFNIPKSNEFYQKLFNVIQIMEDSPFDVPKVLCHRDTWKNNLMFRKDENGVQCILIDFQTSRYLALTIDVNMAIILTTRPNHHKQLRNHYLEFYFKNLIEKLKKFKIDINSVMNFENYLKSCEYHKKVLLIYKAIAVMLTQPPQELFKDFTEADYKDFAEGDRCRLVLKFMEQNEFFKECLVEAVQEIVEEFCC